LLQEKSEELWARGLFMVGDSAYGLAPYLMVPYDKRQLDAEGQIINLARDAFNYHLSLCQISIECAFGELTMKWGIFWWTLLFDLKKCSSIIQVTMLLQNFTIENWEDGVQDNAYFANFNVDVLDPIQMEITQQTGEMPRAGVVDNNEPWGRGCRTLDESLLAKEGETIRNLQTTRLAVNEMRRPLHHDMYYNSYGHIYMSS
jgi:hypothetical protein